MVTHIIHKKTNAQKDKSGLHIQGHESQDLNQGLDS